MKVCNGLAAKGHFYALSALPNEETICWFPCVVSHRDPDTSLYPPVLFPASSSSTSALVPSCLTLPPWATSICAQLPTWTSATLRKRSPRVSISSRGKSLEDSASSKDSHRRGKIMHLFSSSVNSIHITIKWITLLKMPQCKQIHVTIHVLSLHAEKVETHTFYFISFHFLPLCLLCNILPYKRD